MNNSIKYQYEISNLRICHWKAIANKKTMFQHAKFAQLQAQYETNNEAFRFKAKKHVSIILLRKKKKKKKQSALHHSYFPFRLSALRRNLYERRSAKVFKWSSKSRKACKLHMQKAGFLESGA